MRGLGRLALTVWLCAAIVQVLALATFFATLENVKTRLAVEQLRTLVNRVEGPAAARAALGYPLEYQADLQALVESLSLAVKRSADIYITDAQGVVVFASEHERIGEPVPGAWLQGTDSSDGWVAATAMENVFGARVVNAFGERSGTIVARALRRDVIVDVISAMRTPAIVAGLSLGLAGVLAVAGTALATRAAARRYEAGAEALDRLAAAVSAGKAPDAEDLAALPGVGDVLARVAAVEEEARRLDRPLRDAAASASAASPASASASAARSSRQAGRAA